MIKNVILPDFSSSWKKNLTSWLTFLLLRFIIGHMSNKSNNYLEDILALEQSVRLALEKLTKYKNENTALKQKMESLTLEKSLLLQKNDQAKNRLESMITRLKSLEQQSS